MCGTWCIAFALCATGGRLTRGKSTGLKTRRHILGRAGGDTTGLKAGHNGNCGLSIGELDVDGAVAGLGSEIVDGGDDALGLEMPFHKETVGGKPAMKRASGDAIEIGDVFAADGTEPVDVEVSVFGFEGIEGPLDKTDATAEGIFALEELQPAADAAVAV